MKKPRWISARRCHFPRRHRRGSSGRPSGKRSCSLSAGRPLRRAQPGGDAQSGAIPAARLGPTAAALLPVPAGEPGRTASLTARGFGAGDQGCALGVGARQRRPHRPTGFGFCCFLSGNKKSFSPETAKHCALEMSKVCEEGPPALEELGPWTPWLWDLRSLQKARESSVE